MPRLIAISLVAFACTPAPVEQPPPSLPDGTIRGRVVQKDAAGVASPIAQASVALPGAGIAVTSGGDGKFEITGMSVGRYDLVVSKAPEEGARISVKVAPSIDLGDVVVAPPGSVHVVVSRNAVAAAGVRVVIAGVATGATDAKGEVTISRMVPGTYELTAIAGGAAPVVAVDVKAGATVNAALDLSQPVLGGTLKVHVAGLATEVSLQRVDDRGSVALPAVSAEPGTFASPDVPAGIYTVIARRRDGTTTKLPLLFPGATTGDLLLSAPPCSCQAITIADRDGDGVPDDVDDCPDAADPGQTDTNGDGLGDTCVCPKKTCEQLGANCGPLDDGCGTPLDCGDCTLPETCGEVVPHVCGCAGEPDAFFCAAEGVHDPFCDVVTATDRCGVVRHVDCGTCALPNVCGGPGPNLCGCLPDSDAQFCAAHGASCGALEAVDNCAKLRDADCGDTCTGFAWCGGGGVDNKCGCTRETDAELCGSSCDTSITVTDRCGAERTVSCGGCTAPMGCGAAGTLNVCECPVLSDAEFCASLGWSCGTYAALWCDGFRTTNCGDCYGGETCGGDGTPHECGVTIDSWRAEHPALGSADLRSVMVQSSTRAWAVGNAGTVLRWDGTTWTRIDTGTAGNNTGVWANNDSDVWVTSDRAIPAVGRVLHWNGLKWTRSREDAQDYSGVWASGPSDVWVTSTYGGGFAAWKYGGATWAGVDVGLPGSPSLFAVSGSGPGDVWVAGFGAAVAHLENGAFVDRSLGPSSLGLVVAVHARATNDVWFGGALPTNYHWDGGVMSTVAKPNIYDPQAIWADGPGTYSVATPQSPATQISRFSGTWATSGPLPGKALAIHGTGATAFTVGTGGMIAKWGGGASWTPAEVPITTAQLRSIWQLSNTEGWAVGGGNGVVSTALHHDATGWKAVAVPSGATNLAVNAVWGANASNVWMVGGGGHAWNWDGNALTHVQLTPTQELTAIWGVDANDVWAAGGSATGVLLHKQGATWNPVTPAVAATRYMGIWGTGANDVWVAAANGLVQRWDGNGWTTMRPSSNWALWAISGSSDQDVYLAIADGVYRYNGTSWTREVQGGFFSVLAVGGGEAWAYGGSGQLFHRAADGTWTGSWTGITGTLLGLSALSPGDVRAVGTSGAILRRQVP